MAVSSAKGFTFRKSLTSKDEPTILEFIIDNSEQVTVGDAVDLNAGFVQVVDPGDAIAGIVVGIVDSNGRSVFEMNSSVTGSVSGDDTYTSASNNQTVDMARVQIITSQTCLFENKADSSLTQAEVGTNFDTTATGDQVTGTGNAATFQLKLVELVTIDGGGAVVNDRGLFKIHESQFTQQN